MFSVGKKIWLDSGHIYDHFFVVDSEEFDIVFTFESQNGVRARPFWGQLRVFPQPAAPPNPPTPSHLDHPPAPPVLPKKRGRPPRSATPLPLPSQFQNNGGVYAHTRSQLRARTRKIHKMRKLSMSTELKQQQK